MRTEEELRQLARDYRRGRIFDSSHLKAPEIYSSFLPIGLMSEPEVRAMLDTGVTVIWQYLDQAAPIGVNGNPIFMAFQTFTRAEATRINELLHAMEAAEVL